ncbi:MAG: segregation/condensation protein A [Candidatus Paceibacterota bacterium]|jgi:segregation and condensation protein A
MDKTDSYQIKTPIFEGPLDLLLNLIENRKLFVNEISLSQVTDDYIEYIKNFPKTDMAEISGFIIVAATLILIKSKSLLPNVSLTDDEEVQISNLEDRLKIYKTIKDLSVNIKNNFGKNIIFNKSDREIMEPVFMPDEKITIENLSGLIRSVIDNLPKKEILQKVSVKKVISIEEMINSLTDRIQSNLKTSFKELSKNNNGSPEMVKENKIYVIVSFLAILELVRQGVVAVMQDNNFDDIQIEKSEILITENL